MNWLKLKNNEKVNIDLIPELNIKELRDEIISLEKRPLAFFGKEDKDGAVKLFVCLADDINGEIYLSSSLFGADEKSYEAITPVIPSFHMFEREFYEEFAIEPLGHPWLKPVRKNQDDYKFFQMEGDEIHQVAVGPIHAGVIEPGHFRFMCNGENVYHLEIMLGYQNKGTENLMATSPTNQLAESIAGDTVIGHNLAYSRLIEILSDIKVSQKAELIRLIALEMERIAIHIGDMGAIAGDIAYLMGACVFGVTRTLVINTMLEFSGSRFGRGLVAVGGVNFEIDKEKINNAQKTFEKVITDVERMTKTMLRSTSVMSRLEKTGYLGKKTVLEAGFVGMAAKASGVNLDTRFNFPDGRIEKLNIKQKEFNATGDVLSRFKLRYKEILESYSIIKKCFKELENHKNESIIAPINSDISPNSFGISITEGWRGEIVHIAMTDENGKISRYKIKDPSFNNWYALALAVRNNGISDFPLCNKSFNLSYSGNDL